MDPIIFMLTTTLSTAIRSIISEYKYGVHRNTILASKHAVPYLQHFWNSRLEQFSAHVPQNRISEQALVQKGTLASKETVSRFGRQLFRLPPFSSAHGDDADYEDDDYHYRMTISQIIPREPTVS